MPISFDFLLQFFAFSAGAGIVLVYAYWNRVQPDPRLRWALLVLICVVINYLLGLYAFLLDDDLTVGRASYVHFALQSLTLMGLLLGTQQLLRLLGAQPGLLLTSTTWISLLAMAVLSMAARAMTSPVLLTVSSACFVLTGVLLLGQFWRFSAQQASHIRLRRLALLGLSLLLPAFVLQLVLPERWLVVHPVDALAYLYVMGCALWIALDGLRAERPADAREEAISLSSAQQRFDLTEREYQVLRLLVQAKPYKTIADQLSISAHTVKTHASNVYRKTGIQRKAALKHRFYDD